ncbi:rRNA N6-adenosine-methyltransferase ZCCHC4-like isoform X2 [Watersipora subatra]|uniref:rRNA N6-adenosine-methyltransferase ZCCHC4-like isoform X2 n=1 Tax=Watersipora subatra TaxID=2589382 RepID=UPI00355AF3E1
MDCGVIIPNDLCTNKSHPYQYKELSTEEFHYPSRWLRPKESNQTNAQYFFSPEVIEFLGAIILQNKADRVLCVGVPSVHEHVKRDATMTGLSSFLLDIDVRLRQFHRDFAQYNMFNHHFYGKTEQENYEKFVQDAKRLVIIVDPPYGGLLGALQLTLNKMTASTAEVTTIVFLPYFMETQVRKHLPSLSMSDYKVNYTNHSGYTNEGKPRGSPARLYTDLPLKDLVLPTAQGYRYCEKCQHYISRENAHCPQCDSCTTKDGPTYEHCNQCKKCRKSTWIHCDACDKCVQVQHGCAKNSHGGDATIKLARQKVFLEQPNKRKLPRTELKRRGQIQRKKAK